MNVMDKEKQEVLNEVERLYGKDTVCYRLYNKEPRCDLLHQLVGCSPGIKEVTKTVDGFFMGMAPGDIGYNIFLGKPSDIAKQRSHALFNSLDKPTQERVEQKLMMSNISLIDVGVIRLESIGKK